MGIKLHLTEELKSQLEEVNHIEVGSEKYKVAMDGITDLADRIIELEKMEQADSDNAIKYETLNTENELKAIELKNERRNQNIKIVGGIGLGVLAFMTSDYGRAAFQKIRDVYTFYYGNKKEGGN